MHSVAFIIPGPSKWASTRLRAEWPARYIPGAVVVPKGTPIPPAENYVWIKGADVDFIKAHPDAKHFWDVCDPAWWFSPAECREIAPLMEAVVASCPALAADYTAWASCACYTIHDRLELEHYPVQRTHEHYADPVRFIWYGASQNRVGLFGGIANLQRLAANGVPLELTIFDDAPQNIWSDNQIPIYHTEWTLAQENAVIAAHDIAILPPYPGPWGKVKSNNRQLTAWACGLPATDGQDYEALYRLATERTFRQDAATLGYRALCADYDVQDSAIEWRRLLNV